MKRAALLCIAFASIGIASGAAVLAPFSSARAGGPLPAGWRIVPPPKAAPGRVALEAENGATVLRIDAHAAVGTVAARMRAPGEGAKLAWRWRVDRVVEAANLATRTGDDYAARVYVTFDVPLERLGFAARTRLRLARLFYGPELPAAAICYVWDNRHAPGTQAWNAYSDHVRMVVVESGAAHVAQWREEARDISADYQAAFGARWPGATPAIDGIAVSSDTDQTGESVSAWFGDLRLEPGA